MSPAACLHFPSVLLLFAQAQQDAVVALTPHTSYNFCPQLRGRTRQRHTGQAAYSCEMERRARVHYRQYPQGAAPTHLNAFFAVGRSCRCRLCALKCLGHLPSCRSRQKRADTRRPYPALPLSNSRVQLLQSLECMSSRAAPSPPHARAVAFNIHATSTCFRALKCFE